MNLIIHGARLSISELRTLNLVWDGQFPLWARLGVRRCNDMQVKTPCGAECCSRPRLTSLFHPKSRLDLRRPLLSPVSSLRVGCLPLAVILAPFRPGIGRSTSVCE